MDSTPHCLAASDSAVMLVGDKSTTFLDAAGKAAFSPLAMGRSFGATDIDSPTTFAAGVFYFLGDLPDGSPGLVAVDSATGKQKWAVPATDQDGDIRADPAYVAASGNTVYVCGSYVDGGGSSPDTGFIWAFDTAAGRVLWRTQGTDIDNVLVPPSGRYLLSGTAAGQTNSQVQMLDAANRGARGWKKPAPHAHYSQMGWPLTGSAHGLFVFGGDAIFAVDQATGQEAWHLKPGPDQSDVRFGIPFSSLDANTVYVPVGQDIVAVNAADGNVKWTTTLPPHVEFIAGLGDVGGGSARCSADTVFATDSTKTLWAIDAATGKARWKYNDPGQPDVGFKWTVGGDHVFIASNLTVTAIAAHG
ncbi:PQQ-binding-like beta-propeller repeat protein [Streptomyces sp. NPDC001793]|uniref:PQQ-binding-like beta-propeller repeat protein n=1 Tax=Streptomyces sp. NPDC001793 TaxID=3154657 RepID=UPI00332B3488